MRDANGAIRTSNLSVVLRTVLSAPAPLSRAAIAAETGLTKATVSRLIEQLLDGEIISELPPESGRAGRPSLPIAAASAKHVAIGMEVNLRYISVIVMDLAGDILYSATESDSFRDSDPSVVLPRLAKLLSLWSRPHDCHVLRLTLCIPGLVDDTAKHILTAPNLGWSDVDPLEHMDAHFPEAEFSLLNEADAAAYSALYSAPGKRGEFDSFVYISGEVGVGAAIIFEGEIFRGKNSWAGEVGHMCVDPTGPACRCGANGCLEQYVGSDALLSRSGLSLSTSVDELFHEFRSGNPEVRAAFDDASVSLGRGIANILNLLDLDVVIFGGHLARLLPHIEHVLRSELEYRALSSRWQSIELLANTYGNLSASIGVAYRAFDVFIDEVSPTP